jgi:branched-chain amino acid transport system substrate-binding protein
MPILASNAATSPILRLCRFLRRLSLPLLLLASVPSPAAEPSVPPLRIGVSLGTTGAYAVASAMTSNAYRLWERDVNRRGGILGRKVEVVIRDDRSDPAAARRIYEDFILRDKLDFVFGPYSSTNTAAIAALVDQHGYPTLTPGSASDELWKQGYTHLFGIKQTGSRYALGFLSMLAEAGFKRIAIVHADDSFSQSLAAGAVKWAVEYDLRVTYREQVAKGRSDLDAVAQAAHQSGAEALIMGGLFDEAVNMRRALKRIDWKPRAYYASVGPALDAYQNALGADAEGAITFSGWEPRDELGLPGSREFVQAYRAAYGDMPGYHAAEAYATGQILHKAIQKAGSMARPRVREELARLDTESILGRYAVDRTGVQTKRDSMLTQWQSGRREIIYPAVLRTAAPILGK